MADQPSTRSARLQFARANVEYLTIRARRVFEYAMTLHYFVLDGTDRYPDMTARVWVEPCGDAMRRESDPTLPARLVGGGQLDRAACRVACLDVADLVLEIIQLPADTGAGVAVRNVQLHMQLAVVIAVLDDLPPT